METVAIAGVFTGGFWAAKGVYKASTVKQDDVGKNNVGYKGCKLAAALGSGAGAIGALSTVNDIDNKLVQGAQSATEALKTSQFAKSTIGDTLKTAGKFACKHTNKALFLANCADVAATPDDKKIEVATRDFMSFGVMRAIEIGMKTNKGKKAVETVVEKLSGSTHSPILKGVLTAGLIVGGSTLGSVTGQHLGEAIAAKHEESKELGNETNTNVG